MPTMHDDARMVATDSGSQPRSGSVVALNEYTPSTSMVQRPTTTPRDAAAIIAAEGVQVRLSSEMRGFIAAVRGMLLRWVAPGSVSEELEASCDIRIRRRSIPT